MTNEQRFIENQIHGLLKAATTLAHDYGLHETERDLKVLANNIQSQRKNSAQEHLNKRAPQ